MDNIPNFFGKGNPSGPLNNLFPVTLPKPIRRFFEEAEEVLNHSDKYQLSTWWSVKNLIIVRFNLAFDTNPYLDLITIVLFINWFSVGRTTS